MKKIWFTIIFICVVCVIVKAQNTVTATSTVTAKIPYAMQLAVTTGAAVDFDFTGKISQLATGMEKLNAIILTYSSNKPWFLNINATTNNFSGGSSSNPMPASVLQFKNDDNGSYAPLSTTPKSIRGTTGSKIPQGAGTVGLDIKMTPGPTVTPATDYSIGITYTLSNL